MPLQWGILATGRIAHTLTRAINRSTTSRVVAVGSRTQESAQEFARQYEDVIPHASYEELIADEDVNAIYVATPHPQHAEWTIKSIEAGKAVLCEKPMGVNFAEVMAMVHSAEQQGGFLMEAFMYRLHPQVHKVVELVREGAIGELRHVHAAFGFHAPFNPESRLFANELAGGGIMDVGCYPVSFTRLIVGAEPTRVSAHGLLSETGVDLFATGLLHFEEGISAHVATGVGQQLDNTVEIFGSRGRIRVPQPWLSPREWSFEFHRNGQMETIDGDAQDIYVNEIDEVARCVDEGLTQSPAMDWEDSLSNARTLDMWRQSLGLQFTLERPEALVRPVHGRPLHAQSETMKYGSISGLNKQPSRVVFGCDNQPSATHANVMFDDFFEAGGNVFDTAHIYGGGRMEEFLGQWMRNRNIRDELVLIGKGAHTPMNRPEFITRQLDISLERLQSNHIDLYFLHRDNVDVPVAEWIDALNEERDRGRISVFGGSNWSLDRVKEANEWARKSDKSGFTAVSNQFSLAKMLDPVWAGCISANEDTYIEYLSDHQLALFPWSSQARGFFTSRVDEIRGQHDASAPGHLGHQPSDDEMVRCWFSDENFERRSRAIELAKKYDVDAINIALAYVLQQPFPCFPLIGPRQLSETSSCLRSLEIELSDNDLDYLNLSIDSIV